MLFNQKRFGIYILTERQETVTCNIAPVRRPSLSFMFYKENRNKHSVDSVGSANIQMEATKVPSPRQYRTSECY